MSKASELLETLTPVEEGKKQDIAKQIDSVKSDIMKMEKSLDKYMNMPSMSDKDKKDMRKILADIGKKEDEMSKLFDDFMKL